MGCYSSLVQTKEINYTKERYLPHASQLVLISTAIPAKNINALNYTLQPPLGTVHVTHVSRNVLQNKPYMQRNLTFNYAARV